MFIAALFIIAKLGKQAKCLSIDKWIKKQWYTTMECYLAIKNEIFPFMTTLLYLEGIALNEMSDREIQYHVISLVCGTQKTK